MRYTLLISAFCLLLAACAQDATTHEDDLDAIRSLIESVEAANNEGDVDTWVGSFDDPFWYLPSFSPAVTNRDSLRAMTAAAFSGWQADIEILVGDIQVEGYWANVYSEVRGIAVSPDKSDTANVDVKQLVVYHKTGDGWKISRMMNNPNEYDM